MSQNADQPCIDRVINGDTQAFSVLVDRYKYMVYTLAMKILRNHEEAEEVSQDVFLKVFQALASFKGDSKFSTWIYKITYNKSLDYLKKQGRHLKTASIDQFREYNIASLDNAIDALEADDRKVTIKNAMKELAEDDAIVLTLHYYEELSLKEISKIMGIAADTVKVRLFRSRKRLAKLLQDRLEPETLGNYGKR
ncbi:sigma-70 family RNA polymerase sigma factor [Flavobacteriaceae bacterium TP-CH-4]|uniref:Sigma-70 family RNA polymerase sigma factor n=1 Tax=Pelagihabitans pacificus TaxID=2696054 RepID=A0A967ARC9_9FLAO|nr:sigma-70 family RNA polymerase sigma factor [Pelagihabitans pacificus]NHF58085.1 sigma-70 family RNA polymerase sigma factor [Pelagihabitans pacificus]